MASLRSTPLMDQCLMSLKKLVNLWVFKHRVQNLVFDLITLSISPKFFPRQYHTCHFLAVDPVKLRSCPQKVSC